MIIVLLILMGVLLFRGPHFTVHSTTEYNDNQLVNIPDTPVACGSVLTVGWPTDHAVFDDTQGWSTSTHYDLPDGVTVENDQAIRYGLEQECNERRDTYIAFLIILAIPVCLLGALAISRPPQARVEVGGGSDADQAEG